MISAYTCLLDSVYDKIEPVNFGDGVPFILFTDLDVNYDGWTIKRVKRPIADPNLCSRYYFCQSCLMLPDYNVTLEFSADVSLQMSPKEIVKRFLPDGYDIACFAHPHRNTVYEEADACIRLRKDEPGPIRRQMERYRHEGFPGDDLSACTLLIRRNTQWVAEFEDLWWHEVQNGSRRNQLSFDYCRWRLGLEVARIPGNLYRCGDIMKVKRHLRAVHFG